MNDVFLSNVSPSVPPQESVSVQETQEALPAGEPPPTGDPPPDEVRAENEPSSSGQESEDAPSSDAARGKDPGEGELTTGQPNATCQLCKQTFKNARGLRTHISRRHPAEADRLTLQGILKKSGKVKDPSQVENEDLARQTTEWAGKFNTILSECGELNKDEFDRAVGEFLSFLRKSNDLLPGPKHPAARYYKLRKEGGLKNRGKGAGQVSNPQRANKAARERRQAAYEYDLAQYFYYNRRKKVAHAIMNHGAPKSCQIAVDEVEKHFQEMFEKENASLREHYEPHNPNPQLLSISLQEVIKAIKKTSLDSSPGPDGVLIRTVKALKIPHIIKTLAEIMLNTAYVPASLRIGRTILIYKGKGSRNKITSWRPITVYPILRRIIEKVLDTELRKQAKFHRCQRGFVRGTPGCHVNSRLMEAIIKDAKNKKKDAVITFLDVVGAFDNIGHGHIIKSLQAKGVSEDLIKLVSALLCDNT